MKGDNSAVRPRENRKPTPIIAVWLVTAAISLSTWLIVFAQIRGAYQFSSLIAQNLTYNYLAFAFILTVVFASVASIVSTFLRRLISSENSMRRLASEMRKIAEFDFLTGLPNRHSAMLVLKEMMSDGFKNGFISLLFIDIDNFKKINDTLGHNCGDDLLKRVAKRLSHVAGKDSVVARIGGDEFVIIVDGDESSAKAEVIAANLITEFEIAFGLLGDSYVVRLSIGISTADVDTKSEFELLTQADLAMYSAKSTRLRPDSKGYVHYSRELSTRVLRDIERQQEIQYALRGKEFFLDFQSIIDNETKRAIGAEAILKWNHPQNGIVSSNEFLPFAEETGFGSQIGNVALEILLRQLTAWRACNVAPEFLLIKCRGSHLLQDGFPSMLTRQLLSYEIEPSALGIELSEQNVLGGGAELLKRVEELQERGFKITVSEFGAGLTAFALLRSKLFTGVKVDRRLFRTVHTNRENLVIFEGIVNIALELGLSVIVDGVDEPGHMDWLRRYRGVAVQGNIAPSVSADAYSPKDTNLLR